MRNIRSGERLGGIEMKPEEFTSFDKAKPDDHRWLIVTNNIEAKNAHKEMSHVWLTTFWSQGKSHHGGIVTFDDSDRKIINLTHWKYV